MSAQPRTVGPTWIAPLEFIRASANAAGAAQLVRVALRGALFRPHATVTIIDGRFIGEVRFEEPKYPGREQFLAVALTTPVRENA